MQVPADAAVALKFDGQHLRCRLVRPRGPVKRGDPESIVDVWMSPKQNLGGLGDFFKPKGIFRKLVISCETLGNDVGMKSVALAVSAPYYGGF